MTGRREAGADVDVPYSCPRERFTAVSCGQQRSTAVGPDLRQYLSMRGGTLLPK